MPGQANAMERLLSSGQAPLRLAALPMEPTKEENMELLLLIALVLLVVLEGKRRYALKRIKALSEALDKRNLELEQLEGTARGLRSQVADLKAGVSAYKEQIAKLEAERTGLLSKVAVLSKYQGCADAEQEARMIMARVSGTLERAKMDARERVAAADQRLRVAGHEAEKIIAMAKARAEEIAGDAYKAMNRAQEFTRTALAMKNIINGYGDDYIVPTYHLLDDLADEFGFADAGQKLKAARDTSRSMVKNGLAATCEYVELERRVTAVRFVIDAFNGKVDSILSRSKADNHGKLEQAIRDAFYQVNHNGAAFRNARITDGYLSARLDELKWAAIAQELKEQERDEQRRLREQIREEEKARREYERAIKEAAKEEEMLRKAMEKVQQRVAAANDAQRADFEAKLLELQGKLQAAEEKNQRALSMAQQTRSGHVYVISNIGSFGEEVFKIGMTRRLEPADRIRELGDASVPFAFDVHAMIFSEDAPGLEKALHRHFLRQQVNKVNPRKEFFRIGLEDIRKELETLGIETHWTMLAEAHEYRESQRIEQQILENPAIAEEWSRHQELEIEAEVEEVEAVA